MILDIFSLAPGGGLDLSRKVAEVTVDNGQVSLHCLDPRREKLLKGLFLEDAARFLPGDAQEIYAAGTPEAIRQVVEDDLYGFSLGARVRPDGSPQA